MDLFIKTQINLVKYVESHYFKRDLPSINIGDTVRVGLLIQEGNKERTQFSQGVIISKNNAGVATTITQRCILQGVGVEKVYLIHSPKITSIKILRKSKIRRSKLYYLRNLSGKATRLKQRFI
uniref:Large ribosomal subunit protein bL19c n=1 Tax=Compsopogon caeruleus TaxID=31354 RepID=A0A1Z1XB19_9RHOD|nr:50S ribosomal protein L19 [Compsopogon caeruleus]ARX96061.1 50S ribosomal protein L19 [Compsopogon caeruleus]